MKKSPIQFLSYYLPQFHPIPENDLWWGKGFTEWTNVTKAKPLFKGHYQPILPADLGFYDLRIPETRINQAMLANEYGIDGFIYYQYWFGNGKMLLERPAEEMLQSGEPNFPFCFCWANETWKGIWHGLDNPKVLIKQLYGGPKDYKEYFQYLLPFFRDRRYIKVDNKPMFHIYRIDDIPDLDLFLNIFNELAKANGFDGMYIISTIVANEKRVLENNLIQGQIGLDSFFKMRYQKKDVFQRESFLIKFLKKIKKKLNVKKQLRDRHKPRIYDYKAGVSNLNVEIPHKKYIPCVFPNWDNSARSGYNSLIFQNANPKDWERHLKFAVKELKCHKDNPQYIVIKSWNEWAEGNYLEPDRKYGLQWLEAVKNVKRDL